MKRQSSAPNALARGRQQRGLGAIAGIVILVILASLGAFIARISTLRSVSTALDVGGSLALEAARSGVEWQAFLIRYPESTGGAVYTCPGAPVNLNFGGALANYTVTVTCAMSTPTQEGSRTIRIYQVTSTACNFPAGGACPNNTAGNTGIAYVERRVAAASETCRTASSKPCP